MKKSLYLLFFLSLLLFEARAQLKPYGVIDTVDLKMTSCDFEKDANAEVLFDYAVVTYKFASIVMERHKRIKIFNDNGKEHADIRIDFYGSHRDETISDIEAETINLDSKAITYTGIDKKLIYTEATDKDKKAIIFSLPNVKAGSVIEYKYKFTTPYPYNYPDWLFQSSIPTRYSEFDAGFHSDYWLDFFRKTYQPMAKDTAMKQGSGSRHIWAIANIKSYKVEPYMDYPEDYFERIWFKTFRFGRTWDKIGSSLLYDVDFGQQLDKGLNKEDEIIAKANNLKTGSETVAYIFNTVKNMMKWNKDDYWFTIDGVKKAWDKKTGNSTEINLILHHLLESAHVKTSLMVLGTRDNGRIDPFYPSTSNFDKTVVYCPVDSANYYILDATSPYNTYNNVPVELMGLTALKIDPNDKKYSLFSIKTGAAREAILINGQISAEGKLNGTLQISSSAYAREKYLKKYNDLGEKKYIEKFEKDDNNLKIMSVKMDNMTSDSLPLIQTIEYNYKSTEPDGDYMYFNPSIFTSLESNPFMSESRLSNIDFRALSAYSINGRYKIPAGYKVDALPKSVSMQMPDKGIVFKRLAAEQDGDIIIHYVIDYKKSFFNSEDYPSMRDFYKKMYEMLNEQIVLKKL